jgi:hypothetical protein
MIKRILGIIIPLMVCATLVAQDYVMFNLTTLELREGQNAALQAGAKRHNAKYHDGTNGPKAYLWSVHTGPKAGQYVWGMGPIQFSHMDEDLSPDHIRDWDNNVAKYAKITENSFMIRDEALTYNPEGEVVGANSLVKRFKVKFGPGHMDAVKEAVGEITKVLEKTNAKFARRVYTSPLRDKYELMLVYPFDSWTTFEDGQGLTQGFWKSFEKINGKGSQKKLVGDVLEKHTHGITNEVMTMVK